MNQILIKGQPVDVEITRKRRLRRLTLKIDMQRAKLKISAPYLLSKREINYFISEKSNWIIKNLEKAQKQNREKPNLKFVSGETVFLQGQEYELEVNFSPKKRTKVELGSTKIKVQLHAFTAKSEQKIQITAALKKFYKNMAKHIINARLEHFNEYYSLKYKRVSIKEMKTRWGSCSGKKNLNFNWKLVLAPPTILDYVVIHELCHLKHMNHSGDFWALVEEKMPNYKKHRKWLRDNAHFLSL